MSLTKSQSFYIFLFVCVLSLKCIGRNDIFIHYDTQVNIGYLGVINDIEYNFYLFHDNLFIFFCDGLAHTKFFC